MIDSDSEDPEQPSAASPTGPAPTLSKAAARTRARQTWQTLREKQPERLERIKSHWREFVERHLPAAGRLLLYLPMSDEIDPIGPLLAGATDPGADSEHALRNRIYVPRTMTDGMEFRQFRPGQDRAVPGTYRVPGPAPDAPLLELPLSRRDIVLVPALGANASGQRLGRGAGYYDRWRARLEAAQIVGLLGTALCDLPFLGESHDLRFNYIITEAGPVRT